MADQSSAAAPKFKTDFGELSGFTRTGFAADNDDLVLVNQRGNFSAPLINRQVDLKLWLGQRSLAPFKPGA